MQAKTSISPRDLQHLIGMNAAPEILDVRTPGEFAALNVPGTRLIALDDLDPSAFLRGRPADGGPVYVLCQSGARAAKAVEKFRRAGFGGCVLVEGGMDAWVDAGLPVSRGTGGALPLARQVQVAVGAIAATGAGLALAVDPRFAMIPLLVGCGLIFAGLTGTCALALLLAKMPWNCSSKHTGSCCSATGGVA